MSVRAVDGGGGTHGMDEAETGAPAGQVGDGRGLDEALHDRWIPLVALERGRQELEEGPESLLGVGVGDEGAVLDPERLAAVGEGVEGGLDERSAGKGEEEVAVEDGDRRLAAGSADDDLGGESLLVLAAVRVSITAQAER